MWVSDKCVSQFIANASCIFAMQLNTKKCCEKQINTLAGLLRNNVLVSHTGELLQVQEPGTICLTQQQFDPLVDLCLKEMRHTTPHDDVSVEDRTSMLVFILESQVNLLVACNISRKRYGMESTHSPPPEDDLWEVSPAAVVEFTKVAAKELDDTKLTTEELADIALSKLCGVIDPQTLFAMASDNLDVIKDFGLTHLEFMSLAAKFLN